MSQQLDNNLRGVDEACGKLAKQIERGLKNIEKVFSGTQENLLQEGHTECAATVTEHFNDIAMQAAMLIGALNSMSVFIRGFEVKLSERRGQST